MRSLTAALLIGALTASSTATAAPKSPHVIVLVWDATRPDHLTPYGYERDTTPNLAKLAEKSLVFDQAFTTAPWTVPSVASLYTGLFSHNHGVDYEAKDFSLSLTDDVTTIAELTKSAGYKTALWTSQPIYVKQPGFLQGFDQHATHRDVPIGQFDDKALEFIDNADGPTMTMLYYLDPHAPYEAKPEHDLWVDKSAEPVNIRGCPKVVDPTKFPPGSVGHCDVNQGKVVLDEAQWQQLRDRYDGELHQNDALLGELMTGLASRGLLDDTIIIFTSDHGEAFNDHEDEKTWHRLPYDTILRIPLIAHLPGIKGRKVRSAVRNIDVLPTIAKAIGAELPNNINGEPLQELAKKDTGDRPVVGSSHFAGAPAFVRTEQFKLMYSRVGRSWVHAFEVSRDPEEKNDLSASQPELVEKLRMYREQLLKSTKVDVGPGDNASQEELDALRALGYVD